MLGRNGRHSAAERCRRSGRFAHTFCQRRPRRRQIGVTEELLGLHIPRPGVLHRREERAAVHCRTAGRAAICAGTASIRAGWLHHPRSRRSCASFTALHARRDGFLRCLRSPGLQHLEHHDSVCHFERGRLVLALGAGLLYLGFSLLALLAPQGLLAAGGWPDPAPNLFLLRRLRRRSSEEGLGLPLGHGNHRPAWQVDLLGRLDCGVLS
mmetsp:Transcript_71241/g.170138  ORF Transcript_71241/g.170138 Transcript_71241/m.170138 type:complete len:210 (-) Transcript_71241:788-1417(-)